MKRIIWYGKYWGIGGTCSVRSCSHSYSGPIQWFQLRVTTYEGRGQPCVRYETPIWDSTGVRPGTRWMCWTLCSEAWLCYSTYAVINFPHWLLYLVGQNFSTRNPLICWFNVSKLNMHRFIDEKTETTSCAVRELQCADDSWPKVKKTEFSIDIFRNIYFVLAWNCMKAEMTQVICQPCLEISSHELSKNC